MKASSGWRGSWTAPLHIREAFTIYDSPYPIAQRAWASQLAGVENVLDIRRGGIDSTLLGLGRSAVQQLSPDDIVVATSISRRSVPRHRVARDDGPPAGRGRRRIEDRRQSMTSGTGNGRLAGRTVAITGAASGIGLAA